MSQATATQSNPAPGFVKHPGYSIKLEPCAKRVRVFLGDECIAESTATLLMCEGRYVPIYYFPRDDVRMDLLKRTDHHTYCPFKGEASYWTVNAGGKSAENAVWGYNTPYDEMAALKDYVAFYWDRMDAWFEEDEEVFVHARDPFKRIDVVLSHRPVRVLHGGKTLAETSDALFLFETGLPTRYYIPRADVNMNLLIGSNTVTRCPYKGETTHFSADIDGEHTPDIAWSYPEPIAEVHGIAGYICFYNERVDAIEVDGEAIPKVETPWSQPKK